MTRENKKKIEEANELVAEILSRQRRNRKALLEAIKRVSEVGVFGEYSKTYFKVRKSEARANIDQIGTNWHIRTDIYKIGREVLIIQ